MVMGRPREFDVDRALDSALDVFWRNGYEGASIADLTAAMGIKPPSLYAAFGNKEGLFRKALDRYIEQRTRFWDEALSKPTARSMVEHLLHGGADFLTEKSNPHGCMLVRSAMSCAETGGAIHLELTARRAEGEAKLRERFQEAKKNGEMPSDLEPTDYARFIMTMLEGMSVRAAAGATRRELRKIADMALRSWPV
jgi:AcrR family transcriptional regulator